MDFYTQCYIPSIKKELKINKINFGDYFQLNSYIKNSDYDAINELFDKICKKSLEVDVDINNLDKFAILLHLRSIFLSPVLKLNGKNKDDKPVVFEILIKNVLNSIRKYNQNEFFLPKKLYYENVSDICDETGKNTEEIINHINQNKILMFEVPEPIKKIPNVYINCFDNTLFYFCKLLYSTNLFLLYQKIGILKKKFNFLLSEVYEMNPKELDIFLNTK